LSDSLESHDFEDIITMINGRLEIVNEIKNAPTDLTRYLAHRFSEMLEDKNFISALPGHFNYGVVETRLPIVTSRPEDIAQLMSPGKV